MEIINRLHQAEDRILELEDKVGELKHSDTNKEIIFKNSL